jgi:hypothetical protein
MVWIREVSSVMELGKCVCQTSEFASDVLSCELYVARQKVFVMQGKTYHGGVTSVEDLTPRVCHGALASKSARRAKLQALSSYTDSTKKYHVGVTNVEDLTPRVFHSQLGKRLCPAGVSNSRPLPRSTVKAL